MIWRMMTAIVLSLLLPLTSAAADLMPVTGKPKNPETEWRLTTLRMNHEKQTDHNLGWSYVISGSIGFLGGFAGQEIATDPFEKGAYTVFQSIGIAAIGYGLYRIYVGSEDQNFYRLLDQSDLTIEQREKLFRSYQIQKAELERNEKRIRALTHGLIALLNINSASQQNAGVVKDSLYFIGGVNLLACASYAWEF